MKKIIVILRTICIVIVMIFATLTFIPNIIGISSSIDLLGTMEPTITKNSINYINKNTKYENIKVNDIIEVRTYNQKIIARVISKDEDNNTLSVKGDAEDNRYMMVISSENYVGKYIFTIPKIGIVLLFLQRNFFITVVLVLIIIISLIIDFIKYKNIDITKTLKLNKSSKNNNKKEEVKEEIQQEVKLDEKIKEKLKEEESKDISHEEKKKVVKKNPNYKTEILDDEEVNEILEILDLDKNLNKKVNNDKAEIIKTIDDDNKDDDIEILK